MKLLEIVYNNCMDHKKIDYCFYENTKGQLLKVGFSILVEVNQIKKIGQVVTIKDQYKEEDLPPITTRFLKVLSKKELLQDEANQKESIVALSFAQQQALSLELPMRFVDSFYTYDRKQLYLSYVAENRVDFRELAKILAQKYKTRIELRQIGVRDKAKKIGGLGPCGLFLCCNAFLTDFVSVSINMAKNQFLALNPSKINGLCGRLLCCLNYEDDVYTQLKKELPAVGSLVEIKEGLGKVVSVDIFHRTYIVEVKNKGQFVLEVQS